MSKTLKTPSAETVDFAKDNTATLLKTFTSVVDNVQYTVEAETAQEAQEKLKELLPTEEEKQTENNN
jgi:hypothetical protein